MWIKLRYVRRTIALRRKFYLQKKRYLTREIWRIWEDELERTLRSPLVRREWEKLKPEFESYPAFRDYVERAQSVS